MNENQRWGDDDSSDEEDHHPNTTETAANGAVQEHSSVKENEELIPDSESESEEENGGVTVEEDAEERERRLEIAKQKARENASKKQLAKVSIDDQLDNLDDILNELGIDQVTVEKEENVVVDTEPFTNPEECLEPSQAKRRKPKKKKTINATLPAEETPMYLDGPADVAAILKAKTKRKSKPTTSVAASAAAKELKAQADLKKKKKKDKTLYDR
ncbi:hypothetical protein FisN_5Hu524 [Fistulifera solaris]|uniref:Uncharacterized protein n=1 Tax=Fistulifera solaris TaxID=1519565 RepID=A0A1Z5JTM7_FISSO|nr:hypothetical protein FisN_5Hu524 [Fistulifera solaris]|eukprot:GAX17138.1 hypothetical protein FisN_5Hu524 [Fistulifera solaris]